MEYSKIKEDIINSKLEDAVKQSVNLLKTNVDDGEAYYCLGLCMARLNDMSAAISDFKKAEEKKFANCNMFVFLAKNEERTGNSEKAESYYKEAINTSSSELESAYSKGEYSLYLVRQKMFLKAEKLSKSIMNDYPDNYYGYHAYIICQAEKEDYKRAESFINEIKNKFQENEYYLKDCIDLYEKQHDVAETKAYIDQNSIFLQVIPEETLKISLRYYVESKDVENVVETLKVLLWEYGDKNAALLLMMMLFASKKYKETSEIASYVLENEKNRAGVYLYFALEFQMYSLFYMSEGHPSQEFVRWVEKAGGWCIAFAKSHFSGDVADILSSTVYELFDEINSLPQAR